MLQWFKKGDNFYFNDQWKQYLLKEELTSWVGTPYKHWTGVKQKGSDCAHLVAKVIENMGLTGGKKKFMPRYNQDWHLHRADEFMRNAFETQYSVTRIFTPDSLHDWQSKDFRDGDVVLFKYGFQPAHAAMYFNGLFYQALTGIGVEYRSIEDKEFKERMQYGYRFKVMGK